MEIIKFKKKDFKKILERLTKEIKKGKVLVLPTDTLYGLIADATNEKAVKRVFRIKKRPLKKPLPIFVKDIEMAKKLAKIDKKRERFLSLVWPGKITVVLKRRAKKIYGVDQKTIGLRIPKYFLIEKLLKQTNRPLTGSSANLSGNPPTTKIKEVIKQFKNQKTNPDLILDAGNLPKSKPSVVLDFTKEEIKILRV